MLYLEDYLESMNTNDVNVNRTILHCVNLLCPSSD